MSDTNDLRAVVAAARALLAGLESRPRVTQAQGERLVDDLRAALARLDGVS